jgi:hypothetical protein
MGQERNASGKALPSLPAIAGKEIALLPGKPILPLVKLDPCTF